MNLPKLIKGLASLTACLSLLAGCGGGGGDSTFTTVPPPSGGGGGGGGGGGIGNISTSAPELLYTTTNPTAEILDLELSDDASIVVFISDDDPLGTNPDGNQEIFSIEVASGTVRQLTDEGVAALTMDLTSDGSRVVFHSDEDYAGLNAAGDLNVFIANTDGSGIVQVTSVETAVRPQISGFGDFVVFASNEDLTGTNPSEVAQIFRIDSDGTDLEQVTIGDLDPQWIRLSADGSRIAFQSAADPFGANPDLNFEIFVINPNGLGHMQLTSYIDEVSVSPEISGDSSRIAFESEADLIAGSNPAFQRQIFVTRSDGTGTMQLTFGDRNSSNPDISSDRIFVAFESLADLTGEKPAAGVNDPTIFWALTDGTQLVQVLTDDRLEDPSLFVNTRRAWNPEISADGSIIAFVSELNYSADATGGGEKIFLIER